MTRKEKNPDKIVPLTTGGDKVDITLQEEEGDMGEVESYDPTKEDEMPVKAYEGIGDYVISMTNEACKSEYGKMHGLSPAKKD